MKGIERTPSSVLWALDPRETFRYCLATQLAKSEQIRHWQTIGHQPKEADLALLSDLAAPLDEAGISELIDRNSELAEHFRTVNQWVIEKRVLPMFEGVSSEGEPGVVAIGGSPGAGKTTAARAYARRSSGALVDMDDLWKCHPGYGIPAPFGMAIIDEMVLNSAIAVLRRSAVDALISRRVGVVLAPGLVSVSEAEALIKRFRHDDYPVDMALMATNKASCVAGVADRLLEQRERNEMERTIPVKGIARCYDALPHTAAFLQECDDVQNAFVVRRGPVFTEIPKGASVVDVLEAGRRADFEAADKAALLARADLYETVLLDHPTYASSIRALVNERPMEIG